MADSEQITLVTREQTADRMNNRLRDENGGDTFVSKLATVDDPTTPIARWAGYNPDSFSDDTGKQTDSKGRWNLHRILEGDEDIPADRLGDQDNWDDGMLVVRHPTTNKIVLIGFKGKDPDEVLEAMSVEFGQDLQPYDPNAVVAEPEETVELKTVDDYLKTELEDIAEGRGLVKSGTKQDIWDRLIADGWEPDPV